MKELHSQINRYVLLEENYTIILSLKKYTDNTFSLEIEKVINREIVETIAIPIKFAEKLDWNIGTWGYVKRSSGYKYHFSKNLPKYQLGKEFLIEVDLLKLLE